MVKDHSEYGGEKHDVLICSDDGDFFIMEESGAFCLIEDETCRHTTILKLLERGTPVYASLQKFQTKEAEPVESYPTYQQRYFAYWRQHKGEMLLVVKKKHDLLRCAMLIRRFDPSLDLAAVKEQLLHGNLFLCQPDYDDPEKRKALCELVQGLQREGTEVEVYRGGKKLSLETLGSE